MIHTKVTRELIRVFLILIDAEINSLRKIIYDKDTQEYTYIDKLNMLDDVLELMRVEQELRMSLHDSRTHK